MKRGVCKVWKGSYGFLAGDDGRDVFVFFDAIQSEGHRSLAPGDRVEYEAETTARGLRAVRVFRVTDESERNADLADWDGRGAR